MKLGMDFHGVLNKHPITIEICKAMVSAGHEVHIITGGMWETVSKQEFEELGLVRGVHYTHYFSVADSLIENNKAVTWKDEKNPYFSDEDWNHIKGMYCLHYKIDLHIDDSEVYGKLFNTPYAHLTAPQAFEVIRLERNDPSNLY